MTQHGTTSDDTAAAAAADSRLNKSYAIPELEVFNMLTHPVWVFDIEHKKMHWANKAAIGLWCASSLEELVARDFDTDMSPANRSRMDDQLLQLKAGSKLSESWTMYPNGTKTPTTVNMTGSGIRMQDGRVGVLMEAEISKERYEDSTVRGMEALRQLPVPVFNFDTQGKLIYRNPEAIKVHGLNDEQTDKGGKDADDKQDSEKAPSDMVALFVEQDLGKNILQDVVTEGKDCNIEAELYTNNGASQRWFSVAARRVKNPVAKESKDEHVILLTARDITEILQARKDTATANHKAEFLAVLAHDIRTPVRYFQLLVLYFLSMGDCIWGSPLTPGTFSFLP
jgi:PAS domain-containing protein